MMRYLTFFLVASTAALFQSASALALSKSYTQNDFECPTCCEEYNTHGANTIPLTPNSRSCKGKHHQCNECWDAWRRGCNGRHMPFSCPTCRANLAGVALQRDEERMRAKDTQGALERTEGLRAELLKKSAETAAAFQFRKFDRDIVFDNTLEAKYIIDNSSSMGDNEDAKIIYLCEHTQEVNVVSRVTRWAETLVSLRGHLLPESKDSIFGGVVGHNITRGILAHYYALNQVDPSKGWQQGVDVVTIDAARNDWEQDLAYFQQQVQLLDETILATFDPYELGGAGRGRAEHWSSILPERRHPVKRASGDTPLCECVKKTVLDSWFPNSTAAKKTVPSFIEQSDSFPRAETDAEKRMRLEVQRREEAEGYGEIKHTNAALVIYTDGVPSDFYNNRGARGDNKAAVLGLVEVLKDVAFAAKSEYNVSLMLTINIKTDDEGVIEAYNDVDTQFGRNNGGAFQEAQTFSHIDIVDDALGEAREVEAATSAGFAHLCAQRQGGSFRNMWNAGSRRCHQLFGAGSAQLGMKAHSPLFAYSLSLHRVREAGCANATLDAIDEKETPITPNQMTTFIQSLLGLRKNSRALYPEDSKWSMIKKTLAYGRDENIMIEAMNTFVEPLHTVREQTRDLLDRVQLTNVVPAEVGQGERPWTQDVTLFKYGLYLNEAINFKIHHLHKSGENAAGSRLVSNVNVELARLYIEWEKPGTWGTLPWLASPVRVSFLGGDLDDSRAVCCRDRDAKRQRTEESGGSGSGGSGSGAGGSGSGSGSFPSGPAAPADGGSSSAGGQAGGGSGSGSGSGAARNKGKKRARD